VPAIASAQGKIDGKMSTEKSIAIQSPMQGQQLPPSDTAELINRSRCQLDSTAAL
jgi:hypothetical protein